MHRGSHEILEWDPEAANWEKTGQPIANRNLIFSALADNVAFSVWLLWSVVVTNLSQAGFNFTNNQLFWLVALPSLIGALLRLPYSYAVTRFGGRTWTFVSSLFLLLPTLGLAFSVTNSQTPYPILLAIAATAGLGGGSFAASMTNINFFFPARCKGSVLGFNAAAGNLGVSTVQFIVPFLVVAGGGIHLYRAGYLWAGLSILVALCAWFFMNNLTVARSSLKDQLTVFTLRETWIMSFLYIGTFGSFIGYAAAMPLLINTQFPEYASAHYAFVGGLLGAASRPVGGILSDKLGGSIVTLWTFVLMTVGVVLVLLSLQEHSFALFVLAFVILFLMAGIGNGSTYAMIPAIFIKDAKEGLHVGTVTEQTGNFETGRSQSGALIGIAASFGACGGFLIPISFGYFGLIKAFLGFLAYYVLCFLVTWYFFLSHRTRNSPT